MSRLLHGARHAKSETHHYFFTDLGSRELKKCYVSKELTFEQASCLLLSQIASELIEEYSNSSKYADHSQAAPCKRE